jgi:AmiR/NasT family two-component response regulator
MPMMFGTATFAIVDVVVDGCEVVVVVVEVAVELVVVTWEAAARCDGVLPHADRTTAANRTNAMVPAVE